MNKMWIVLKREYLNVVKKKSFIIGIFLIPILMITLTILPIFLVGKKSTSAENLSIIDRSQMKIGEKFKSAITQYKLSDSITDYYNVVNLYEIDPDNMDEFYNIDSILSQEITENTIKYYLVINQNPQMADSNVYLVTNSQNFVTFGRFTGHLSKILTSIRLEEANISIPADSLLKLAYQIDIATKDVKGETVSFRIQFYTALILILIMYGMIFGYGQMVMRSIIEEKTSRIMEVLVSSISPFQLMMGKIIGLCGATLTQVVIWLVIGGGLYLVKNSMDIESSATIVLFDPVVVMFFVLLLFFGYLLFSTVFALLGSIVNSDKEAQPYLFPIVMMNMLPVLIAIYIIQEPNSWINTTLSFIPFFTPTMMMMRLVVLQPSISSDFSFFSGIVGEASLAVVVLIISIFGLIWLTSKIFRVGILMYGKRPTIAEIFKWIKY
jgi:ABC-2 type transport system permease protein